MNRSLATLVATGSMLAILPAAAATSASTSPPPVLGHWQGTVKDVGGTRPISFRVVKVGSHFEIHDVKTKLQETCVDASNGGKQVVFTPAVTVPKAKIKSTGRFAGDQAESSVTGRVLSGGVKITGTANREADAITCSAPTGKFTAAPTPATVVYTAGRTGRTAKVKRGDTVELRLKGCFSSCGYSWVITTRPDRSVLKRTGSAIHSGSGATNQVHVFRYRAVGAGHTSLKAELRPPGTGVRAAKHFRLSVRVR